MTNRIEWIDGLRGLALLLMLLAHFSPLLINIPSILRVTFKLAPFLFFFLVGMGLGLSIDRNTRPPIFYLLRGIILIVGGLGYNLLEHNLIAGGFFQLIGASTILVFLIHEKSRKSLQVEFLLATLIIAISFPIRDILILQPPQGQLTTLLAHFFFLDYFALFPWLSVVLIGLTFNSWHKTQQQKTINLSMLTASSIFLGIGTSARTLGTVLDFDPVSSSMFFIGLSVLGFLTFTMRISTAETPQFIKRILSVTGNHTIELLVVHWFFFRTLPYYFAPGWKIDDLITETSFALSGILALTALAFILTKIPNKLFKKWVAPLYTVTIGLAILEVFHVVYLGFSLEIYLLAFTSSMTMAFTVRGLRRLKSN